jgi:hypothetical protein
MTRAASAPCCGTVFRPCHNMCSFFVAFVVQNAASFVPKPPVGVNTTPVNTQS